MSLTGLVRARRALRQAGVDDRMALERVPHTLNEVWYAGPYVLRISASPVSRRLEHEANVAAVLPIEVLYPHVVGHGRGPVGEWLLLRRAPGRPLSRTWGEMSDSERPFIETLRRITRWRLGLMPREVSAGQYQIWMEFPQ